MGVFTFCIESTVAVEELHHADALSALRASFPELAEAPSLAAALTALSMKYEPVEGALTQIRTAGGKGDNSRHVWPVLAPFISSGGKTRVQIDGADEIEVVSFRDGKVSVDYEEDDFVMSDAATEFFDALQEDSVGDEEIRAAVDAEGTIDFLDYSRNTPLLALCEASRVPEFDDDEDAVDVLPLVRKVLEYSPNLEHVNMSGHTAFTAACAGGDVKLLRLLLEHGANITDCPLNPVEAASEELRSEVIALLAEQGCNIADSDALVIASALHEWREDKIPFIQNLIDGHGCDANRRAATAHSAWTGELQRGATPLMAAAMSGDIQVVEYLLGNGAVTHVADGQGNTALHYCSGQTWISVDTGVIWSLRETTAAVVRRLLDAGADPAARNAAGQSCIDLATEQGFQEALDLFART